MAPKRKVNRSNEMSSVNNEEKKTKLKGKVSLMLKLLTYPFLADTEMYAHGVHNLELGRSQIRKDRLC